MAGIVSRAFRRRRTTADAVVDRLPPGQYQTTGWPVLSAGPTPRIDADAWSITVDGEVARPRTWTAADVAALPQEEVVRDIHCVTRWSRFDMSFRGVPVAALLDEAGATGTHVMVHSTGGYTTNLGMDDLAEGRAWAVTHVDGEPLAPVHGGPVRLVVPHLYFWKSAKWLSGLHVLDHDEPGFWEVNGYHMHGDPWRQERYSSD